jgi:MoaA/NifB/PqqE/SkfB family radical SAM enzyme
MTLGQAKQIVEKWCSQSLESIRFSGGEPTCWNGLIELVEFTKSRGVKNIAISTNGSANPTLYRELIAAGVNDFSISLDACCSSTGAIMAGKTGEWEKVVDNIRGISKLAYVTVGVVVNEDNVGELERTIEYAKLLGVADVRIISTAQENFKLPVENVSIDPKYSILAYRLGNIMQGRHVRGLQATDSGRCGLVLDDMAVAGRYHFPCIIYLREQGDPIGPISDPIEKVRTDRERWSKDRDSRTDMICSKNCLDVCVDYNNKYREFHGAT